MIWLTVYVGSLYFDFTMYEPPTVKGKFFCIVPSQGKLDFHPVVFKDKFDDILSTMIFIIITRWRN